MEKAFNELKQRLLKAPILGHPRFDDLEKNPFIVTVDWSEKKIMFPIKRDKPLPISRCGEQRRRRHTRAEDRRAAQSHRLRGQKTLASTEKLQPNQGRTCWSVNHLRSDSSLFIFQ